MNGKVKISFDLSKDYMIGMLAVLGAEEHTEEIMQVVGDKIDLDIDKFIKSEKELANIKPLLVSLVMVEAAKQLDF